MALNNSLTSIIFAGGILIITICIFILIYRKLRRRGGRLATVMLGATYDLHGEDKKRAIEAIIEQKSGQKTEEQSSSDQNKK